MIPLAGPGLEGGEGQVAGHTVAVQPPPHVVMVNEVRRDDNGADTEWNSASEEVDALEVDMVLHCAGRWENVGGKLVVSPTTRYGAAQRSTA